jgi:drug/metabolite transporter (DMT)-like permease
LGIALVLVAVDRVVILQKRIGARPFSVSGYFYAAMAALCQALGAVVSRDILTRYSIDAFNASLIRLIGGIFIICLLIAATRGAWLPTCSQLSSAQKQQVIIRFIAAVALGTFAGLYLQMLALTHAKAAVVQTLFATSVILSLLVARMAGERLDKRMFWWSILAFSGVTALVAFE